jgi:hypothetical protein
MNFLNRSALGNKVMHRVVAAWFVEHPWRTAVITACLSVLLLVGMIPLLLVVGAIPALLTLEQGPRAGINAMLAGSAAVIGTMIGLEQPVGYGFAYAGMLFVLPVLFSEVLRRYASLNLVFQGMLLLTLGAISLVFVVLPSPTDIWQVPLSQSMAMLQRADIKVDTTLFDYWVRSMWGAVVALLLLLNFSAVLLARWWQSLIHAPGEFGKEFRSLTAGIALTSVMALLSVASLFSDLAWLDSLAQVAVMGLALLGLAVAHRRKAEGRLRQGWLVTIYVLLVATLSSSVTVTLLAVWGLVDFWRRKRISAA